MEQSQKIFRGSQRDIQIEQHSVSNDEKWVNAFAKSMTTHHKSKHIKLMKLKPRNKYERDFETLSRAF